MKFRMFTLKESGRKVAVNVDKVQQVRAISDDCGGGTEIFFEGSECEDAQPNEFVILILVVAEDFDTVFARLNTVAE